MPLNKGEIFYSFPNLIANQLIEHSKYTGRTFHADCVNNSEEAQRAIEKHNRIRSLGGEPICFISDKPIIEMEDWDNSITIPFFVDDENHPLFKYNCAICYKEAFKNWPNNIRLIKEFKEYESSPYWKGTFHLKILISQLERAIGTDEGG